MNTDKPIFTKIMGVTQTNEDGRERQTIIKKLVKKDEILLLEREGNNRYDKNAIAVYISPDIDPWEDGEYQIGYLSKDLAADLAPLMDSGYMVTCKVENRTGGSGAKETLGVNVMLSIYTPEEVAAYRAKKEKILTEVKDKMTRVKPPSQKEKKKKGLFGKLFNR